MTVYDSRKTRLALGKTNKLSPINKIFDQLQSFVSAKEQQIIFLISPKNDFCYHLIFLTFPCSVHLFWCGSAKKRFHDRYEVHARTIVAACWHSGRSQLWVSTTEQSNLQSTFDLFQMLSVRWRCCLAKQSTKHRCLRPIPDKHSTLKTYNRIPVYDC